MSTLQAQAPNGFAATVQPIAADTRIVTSSEGLRTGDVRIDTADGALPAYFAAPVGTGPFPLVIVVQEIFGVHEHIRDVVRRFAHEGYFAVAPELYFRQGDPAQAPDLDTLRRDIVSQVPDAQVLSDLDATFWWAERHGGNADHAAITGFCWGGRITWLYAAHQPRLRAGVAWYGRLAGPSGPLVLQHPVDIAGHLQAPVLGLYGGADTGIPLADVDRVQTTLTRHGGKSTIHVYDGAPHAFHADYRDSYRAEAAKDGWQRTLAWLRKHGV